MEDLALDRPAPELDSLDAAVLLVEVRRAGALATAPAATPALVPAIQPRASRRCSPKGAIR